MSRTESLVVDHEAAIRKLSWGGLQGAWQIPTELARLAAAAGASSIDLGIERRRIRVTAPEARLPRQTLADLVTLLDPEVGAASRHEALAAVQAKEAGALAASLGAKGTELRMKVGGVELERKADGRILVPRAAEEDLARPGLEIELRGLELEPGRAEAWWSRAGRWSPIRLTLDGRPLPRGFEASILEGRLAGGALPVRLALGEGLGSPRLWLLRHGLLAATATVTDFPAFEAALELGERTAAGDPASFLREVAGRELAPILDGAVDLALLALDQRADREEIRRPLARFLLEVARSGRSAARISAAPLLVVAEEGRRRRLALNDLARHVVRSARSGAKTLEVAGPDTAVEDLRRPTLLAGSVERSLVAEVLGVQLVSPSLSKPPGRGERLRRLLGGCRDRFLALGRPELERIDLTEDELAFLKSLEATVANGSRRLGFHRGSSRVLRLSRRTLLPRRDPLVQRAVDAVRRDPSWAYPAALALLGPREAVPASARSIWLERAGPPSLES